MTDSLKNHWRPFGTTGIQLSPLGFGTVKLGRNQGVKYPQGFTIPDDTQALSLLHQARDLGINLLDTAPAYGNSEERLGQLLKGKLNDWVVCTKVGEEFVNGESHFDFSAEHTRKSIERSLKRLHTEVLDIVLVHSDGNDETLLDQGVFNELERQKQLGNIRAFGMSTKTVAGGIRAAELSDGVMVTYNLAEQGEKAVIDFCQQHNKGVLIKKAFASGHALTNNDNPLPHIMQLILSHPGISSTVMGTINPQHLSANVEAALAFLQS